MGKVKQYGLSRRRYISISDYVALDSNRTYCKKSYGGSQEWFPKEHASIKEHLIHAYGCGVIAITDLFLYWAITLQNGKDTFAARYIDEKNQITKEDYRALVEEIHNRYARIIGYAGTFAPQLMMAINRYAKHNNIGHKAILDMELNDLTMLEQIKKMLEANQPIILMIGHSCPMILSRFRKKGIPFYKQTRVLNPLLKDIDKPYAQYKVMKKNVFGHFVTITGMIIDEQAELASQHIMLRISSWGTEYYISYHHLRQYINQLSKPYLSGMIGIE